MSNVRSDCMVLEVGLDIPSTQRGAPSSRVFDRGRPSMHAGASIREPAWAARPDMGVFLVADGHRRGSGRATVNLALSSIERLLTAGVAGGVEVLAHALAEISGGEEGTVPPSFAAIRLAPAGGLSVVTASVGDCRVYRLRRGSEPPVSRGPDSRSRGAVLSRRVASVQGAAAGDVDVHVEYTACRPGDLFLLCSDSVTAHTDDASLRASLSEDAPLEARCERLVRDAAEQGDEDDATALLVQF